jgi:uncharacterized LabA/DUF88 family protein
MAIRNSAQRVAVLVDVQNLYYSARNIYNSRVNFNEVLKAAVGDRQLVRALAYVIRADMPEEHTFFDALGKAGFELRMKDLQTFAGGSQKGDWDVGIAIDAVRLMPRIDAIVLCAGDGDYVPLVEYLKANGLIVEVCSFGKSTSGKLREVCDDFVDIDANVKKFLMPIKGKGFAIFSDSATAGKSRAEEPVKRVNIHGGGLGEDEDNR